MNCALVTGSSGYIGSRLVERLVADGWKVNVILRPSSSLSQLEACADKITIHRHQGSTRDMEEIVAAAKPDVVFHLAAMATAEHCPEDVVQLITSNVLYSTQLIEAMMRNGVNNLVSTETFWQYRENFDQYDPVCLYAATKQAFRDIVRYYAQSGAIRVISLVLFDTYGPKDPRNKLFSLLRQTSRNNGAIDMTPGDQMVDIVHVNDVVNAYLCASERLLKESVATMETFAVTSGRRMSLRALVELTARETGCSFRVNWGARGYSVNQVMVPCIGKTLPGWQPKIELEDGIQEVFAET